MGHIDVSIVKYCSDHDTEDDAGEYPNMEIFIVQLLTLRLSIKEVGKRKPLATLSGPDVDPGMVDVYEPGFGVV